MAMASLMMLVNSLVVLYPCYLVMRYFSKPRSVPNARPEMIGVVIPHLHFITTHDGMDAGARATH